MSRQRIVAAAALATLLTSASAAAHSADPPGYAGIDAAYGIPADEARLQALRTQGDLPGERRHAWQLLRGLTQAGPPDGSPAFLTWYSAGEVFAAAPRRAGASTRRSLRQALTPPPPRADAPGREPLPPLIVRTHYNAEAYLHIREHQLQRRRALRALQATAGRGPTAQIAAFPREAAVVKSVWWPVPARGIGALPVWDPASNPANAHGNDYTTWARVVGVCGPESPGALRARGDVEFLGRTTRGERCIGIERFFHLVLDAELVRVVAADPLARRLAVMVMGRALRAGDCLALVALHAATRETADWVWGTYWWHDDAGHGDYSTLRPAALPQPWRNYLMDVAFDTTLPRAPDGGPHVTFNPWLEARFPDQGQGVGIVSNCMSCHRRAAFPAEAPLRVTRGGDLPATTTIAAPRLLTSSLWSIPLQAR